MALYFRYKVLILSRIEKSDDHHFRNGLKFIRSRVTIISQLQGLVRVSDVLRLGTNW